jgi:hypothetical protein
MNGLELRNTLGRVISDLLSGSVAAPVVLPGVGEYSLSRRFVELNAANGHFNPPHVIAKAGSVSRSLERLVDHLSGCTALAADVNALPYPDTLPGKDWINVPVPWMWVDFVRPFKGDSTTISLLIFDGEEMGWETRGALISGVRCRRTIYALPFGHGKNPLYRRITGHKWVTGLDGPLVCMAVADDDSNVVDLGASDFLGLDLTSDPMWPEPGQLARYVAKVSTFAMMVMFACNAVANIEAVKVPPARRVPKSEKDLPRFEYRVLKVRRDKPAINSPSLSEQLRRSPRQHLRRGHLRKLPKGDVTWVRPCVVGSSEAGHILHDYLL